MILLKFAESRSYDFNSINDILLKSLSSQIAMYVVLLLSFDDQVASPYCKGRNVRTI